MKSKLTVNDKKWREIKRRLPQLEGASVDVGIQSDAGASNDGTPIAAYAAWNEFGTINTPARSFIRSTADERRTQWNRVADAVIGRILALRSTPEQAFSLLGEQAQGDIKRKIISLRDPANDPATIRRKGSTNPLIDTGAMLNAIRYVVRMGR
jgi:hypothetical protein